MSQEIKERDGFKWLVDSEVQNSDCGLYDHEDWIFKYLYPPQGGVYVDVGSFIGTHAVTVSKKANCKAFAFEPVLSHYDLMLENIKLNAPVDVVTYNLAMGNQIGEVQFKSDGFTSSIDESGDLKVLITTLDSILLPHALPQVNVIKIDVEGYEIDVLNGMQVIVARYKPRVIVEVHSHFSGRNENGNLIVDWCMRNKYNHRRIFENEPGYFYVELASSDCSSCGQA